MDSKNFKDNIKKILNTSVNVSGKFLKNTGESIKRFSDKNILKYEISSIQKKIDLEVLNIGALTYKRFLDQEKSQSFSDDNFLAIIKRIDELNVIIKEKKDMLKKEFSEDYKDDSVLAVIVNKPVEKKVEYVTLSEPESKPQNDSKPKVNTKSKPENKNNLDSK